VDDIAVPLFALWQIAFFVWVSLSEQKWVTFAERRGPTLAFLIVHHLDGR